MTTCLNKIVDKVTSLIVSYINNLEETQKETVLKSLHSLLNGNYNKYNLNIKNSLQSINQNQLQSSLYKINEKTEIRKQSGVYYTPEDVCKFIIWNSIIMLIDEDNHKTYNEEDALNFIVNLKKEKINEILYKYTFVDPTCGSGEYLVNLFKIKYAILKSVKNNYTDEDIYNISKTIFGNDIQEDSTDISKIRIFFEISSLFKDKEYYFLLAKSLKQQFTNIDFILYNGIFNEKFDCVIGNPPYVEYSKYENKTKLRNLFGNVYADVIKNSIESLKLNGVLGFIIPISYISTSRMNGIRDYVFNATERQIILNFADRPDCLFQGVHQKLNIVIARKGCNNHKLYTSNYKHWYKEERKNLLNACEIIENRYISNMYIPKIGNDIENSIYNKITTTTQNNIYDIQCNQGVPLYLNMRGCFWIKAFSFNPGSKEYKKFTYKKEIFYFINCLLNSSLFWLYWTIVSDCWHITSKELKTYYVPIDKNYDFNKFIALSKNLENKLEETKKYIGSKQVEYEYKHKDCKKEIDEIDDSIAQLYNLTNEELNYVKNFALKYRLGGNLND